MSKYNISFIKEIYEENEHIIDSLDFFKDNDFDLQIKNNYDKITSGNCNGCANCCYESVHTYYCEFINILDNLRFNKELFQKILLKIENYYMNDLIENNKCPMLDPDNRCLIYEFRPLVCRLYGHHTLEDHEENYSNVLEKNKEIKEYYLENFSIEIPDTRIKKKVQYCTKYKNNNKVEKSMRIDLNESLLNIDSKFLFEDLIGEDLYDMGLVEWFVYLLLDENIHEERIDYTRKKTQKL